MRINKLVIFLTLIFMGANLFADVIDKPAATVKLEKLEVITVKQFRQKTELIEANTKTKLSQEDRLKLLDVYILEILIKQAAEKENIGVTDSEVDARIKQFKQVYGMSLDIKRELTDVEFKALIQKSGSTWEKWIEQLKLSIIQQKYVMKKKKPFFDTIKPPDENEIKDYYESNKTAFVIPDMVRMKHIYFDTRNLTSKEDREKAGKRAAEAYRELQNGTSFEDLVVKYSDDRDSRYRGGDFGYLRRDDKARKQLLGADFFETPFKMEQGEISSVIKSNVGYHIIKVTEKIPFKLYELDDKIPPQYKVTVRDQVKAQLFQRKQEEYYQKALFEIYDELKKKADIKIFEKNLTW